MILISLILYVTLQENHKQHVVAPRKKLYIIMIAFIEDWVKSTFNLFISHSSINNVNESTNTGCENPVFQQFLPPHT